MSGGGRFGVQGDMQLTSASSELIPESAILRPRGILTFIQGLMTAQARAWRVLTLLVAVAAMSLGDLIMTLTYAQSIGMVELNPLARFLMQSSSPLYIILYKLGSVMIACLILFVARKTRVAELGTWLAFFGLLWLTMRWVQYSEAMVDISGHVHHLANVEKENWVEMGAD